MSHTMEDGLYVARIIGQRINQSPIRKTPYAALHIEIVGRIDLMNPTDPPTKLPAERRTVELWLTDGAAERSVRDLKAIGWTGTSFAEFDDREEGYVDVTGRSIFVSCRIDDTSTPVRERWSITSAPKPVDKVGLLDLDTRFGSLLAVPDDVGPNEPTDDDATSRANEATG